MPHRLALRQWLEQACFTEEQVARRSREIFHRAQLQRPHFREANFRRLHPDDLKLLVAAYDELAFAGRLTQALSEKPLQFRVSQRMTKAGGATSSFGRPAARYVITVSAALLFQTFRGDVQRAIKVGGRQCENRLEALQRILEHELVHLVELLCWDATSCSEARFQLLAKRVFGHDHHRHQLVTSIEAAAHTGVRLGGRVKFRFDGAVHRGIVNRITKRVTVLVEDAAGEEYTDGKRYRKFYVPLPLLEPE